MRSRLWVSGWIALFAAPALAASVDGSAMCSYNTGGGIATVDCASVQPRTITPQGIDTAFQKGTFQVADKQDYVGGQSFGVHYGVYGDYGDLKAYANANVNLRYDGSRSFTAMASASAMTQFSDTVVVKSSTLAQGTLVTLLFWGQFDGDISQFGTDANTALTSTLDGRMALTGAWGTIGHEYCKGGGGGADCDPTNQSFAFYVYTHVGDTIGVSGSLASTTTLSSTIDAAYTEAIADGSANASFGQQLFLDGVTEGVYVAAESGHDYRSVIPVPEPASALLLAAGVAALAVRRRAIRA